MLLITDIDYDAGTFTMKLDPDGGEATEPNEREVELAVTNLDQESGEMTLGLVDPGQEPRNLFPRLGANASIAELKANTLRTRYVPGPKYTSSDNGQIWSKDDAE